MLKKMYTSVRALSIYIAVIASVVTLAAATLHGFNTGHSESAREGLFAPLELYENIAGFSFVVSALAVMLAELKDRTKLSFTLKEVWVVSLFLLSLAVSSTGGLFASMLLGVVWFVVRIPIIFLIKLIARRF